MTFISWFKGSINLDYTKKKGLIRDVNVICGFHHRVYLIKNSSNCLIVMGSIIHPKIVMKMGMLKCT